MELVPGFVGLLQGLSATMTAPTFASLTTVLTGWVFASRHTVTRMILAAGDVAEKHFSSYHRLFSAARWSLDAMGLAVFDLIEPFLGSVVMLGLDDTLARKRGLKMFGTGMHHDPLLSSRGKVITNWGHSWVVLGSDRRIAVPSGSLLLSADLVPLVLEQEERRETPPCVSHASGIGGRDAEAVVQPPEKPAFSRGRRQCLRRPERALPPADELRSDEPAGERCAVVRRAAQRKAGTNGRPRKRGERLPTPQAMLAGRCRRVTLDIYGRTEEARLADQVAHVHAAPERPLRVVAVEAVKGGRGQEAFYSTCSDATAEQVIVWYAMRWSIEVMNHDSKQHLGFEEPQGWTRRSVERTAPLAMLLYSLIVLWFASEGHRSWRPLICPWYTSKTEPSFADMLSTLRRLSVRQQVLTLALCGPGSRKIQQLLENAVTLAA